MKSFSIYKINNGSHQFEIRSFFSEKKTNVVILVLPAMGVRATFYDTFLQVVSKSVCNATVMDWRGHGSSNISFKKGVDANYEVLVSDVHTALVFLQELFLGQKIILVGHSLGGQIAAMVSARYSGLVSGVIFNASCSPYKFGWTGIMQKAILAGAKLYPFLASVYGYFPGHKWGFGNRESKGVINNWSTLVNTGNFNLSEIAFEYEEGMLRYNGLVGGIVYKGDRSAPLLALKNLMLKFSDSQIIFECEIANVNSKKQYNHYSWAKQPELSLPYIQKMVELISGL